MIATEGALTATRIDEWTSLADEQDANSIAAACSCLPKQRSAKVAKPGLRHFVADMPESDQIMVVDDGIPVWVDDSRDEVGRMRMKATRAEGVGLKGMRRLEEEDRVAIQEVREEFGSAGNKDKAALANGRGRNEVLSYKKDRFMISPDEIQRA